MVALVNSLARAKATTQESPGPDPESAACQGNENLDELDNQADTGIRQGQENHEQVEGVVHPPTPPGDPG